MLHVNEVSNDEATDVPKAHLAGDLFSGFNVGLKDGLFHILRSLVAACIDVHRNHSFSLVDDDVATAWKPNLTVKRGLDLCLNAETLKYRLGASVVLDRFFCPFRNLTDDVLHAFDRLRVVHNDSVDFIGEKVADRSLDEIGFFKETGRGGFFLKAFLHLRPLVYKDAQITNKIAGALPRPDCPHNHAHALWHIETAKDLAKTITFLGIFDFTRDAELIIEWHQDEVATSEADVRRDARALIADRTFFDLNEDVRPYGVDIRHIFMGDAWGFFLRVFTSPINGFDATVECCWDGIPELKERIFLESDINEHRLDARFDIANLALVNAADDIAIGLAFDCVFLESVILE